MNSLFLFSSSSSSSFFLSSSFSLSCSSILCKRSSSLFFYLSSSISSLVLVFCTFGLSKNSSFIWLASSSLLFQIVTVPSGLVVEENDLIVVECSATLKLSEFNSKSLIFCNSRLKSYSSNSM